MGRLYELPANHPLHYGYSGDSLVHDNGQLAIWFKDDSQHTFECRVNRSYVLYLYKKESAVQCELHLQKNESYSRGNVVDHVEIANSKMPMQIGAICDLFQSW